LLVFLAVLWVEARPVLLRHSSLQSQQDGPCGSGSSATAYRSGCLLHIGRAIYSTAPTTCHFPSTWTNTNSPDTGTARTPPSVSSNFSSVAIGKYMPLEVLK